MTHLLFVSNMLYLFIYIGTHHEKFDVYEKKKKIINVHEQHPHNNHLGYQHVHNK